MNLHWTTYEFAVVFWCGTAGSIDSWPVYKSSKFQGPGKNEALCQMETKTCFKYREYGA